MTSESDHPIVLAITGASGAIYAVRLMQAICRNRCNVHVTISPSGAAVIRQELGLNIDVRRPDLHSLVRFVPSWTTSPELRRVAEEAGDLLEKWMTYHQYDDYMTPIASGSFRTRAMVVCPCSGSTLSGIARAAASNLIQRAAEVHLKEDRKLVLVPRETPLSVLQLENMQRLAASGAVVLPAMPGWYHGVESLDDIIAFVVSRVLDQLGLDNHLIHRWGESHKESS